MTIEHTDSDLTCAEVIHESNQFMIYTGPVAKWLMRVQHNGEQLVEKQRANLRRMVACWNACKGITTESLEANGAAGYEHTVALTKQANDLRTVLLSIKLEWAALWAAMDALPDDWIRTTDNMYQNMLECVPPRAQAGARFLVGEAKTHNAEGKAVHACFKKDGDSYFAKHMTVEQFKAL